MTQDWAAVISHLAKNPLTDYIVTSPKIFVDILRNERGHSCLVLNVPGTLADMDVTRYSLGMLCTRIGIPSRFVTGLHNEKESWGKELLVDNINVLLRNRTADRSWLLRSNDNTLMGFLSDSYKCLDTVTLLDEFAKCAKQVNALPSHGYVSPLRTVAAILSQEEATVAGHRLRVGMILENSEVGAASANIRFCIQIGGGTMISPKGLTRRHRGRRRTAGTHDQMRDEDSQRLALDLRGQTLAHMTKENIQALLAEIHLSEKTIVDIENMSETLLALGMNEAESEKTQELFANSTALPTNKSYFRLANAVALVAETLKDEERKIALLTAAGSLIMKA